MMSLNHPSRLNISGFVLLKDLRPTEPEVLALTDAPTSTATGATATAQSGSVAAMAVDDEPQPPQPFEYSS
ncbi:hypothetical protein HanPI659440_Chr08g0281251 [Helianthus annuus]|nr:hypothetical protein HanPI659440_Chr08g0281251 [Helianthus annuus]